MATVTGLTADRMLAIEAASVVDGDVVDNNLILTTRGGTEIDAGNVRGPEGPLGPVGSDLSVFAAKQILDVGLVGQIRAGRQLTAADFTDIGLSAPIGLWNLSNLNDSSGNGRNLANKGAVPFDAGINGLATTAAKFAGSAAQALYIADTGASDPFRIKTGSWGCWFRTAKLGGGNQSLLSKISAAAGNYSYQIYLNGAGNLVAQLSLNGSAVNFETAPSVVVDDRWHFGVVTYDGTTLRVYVDGVLETQQALTGTIFGGNAPLNIGATSADSSVAAGNSHYGRVDEAFVTADVLFEDQIRYLYCAKLPHTLGAVPSRGSLNVIRQRKGPALAVADFPVQPVRLHNFSAGSLGDAGSNGVALVNAGTAPVSVSGPDGVGPNAFSMGANATSHLMATDAGLPAGLASRSYGCWFKSITAAANVGFLGWATTGSSKLRLSSGGEVLCLSGADQIVGPFVCDGQWHQIVAVEDNTAIEGVKRKLYVDGRLVGNSTVMNSITLAGANMFRIGANPDGTTPFQGQIDGVFVCAQALTGEQVQSIYAKGSAALPPSPKNIGDHVEAYRANDILATFDMLDASALIDLKVAA